MQNTMHVAFYVLLLHAGCFWRCSYGCEQFSLKCFSKQCQVCFVFFNMALICKLKIGNCLFSSFFQRACCRLADNCLQKCERLVFSLESLSAWKAPIEVQTSEFVVNFHQICQEWFALGEVMLAVTSRLAVVRSSSVPQIKLSRNVTGFFSFLVSIDLNHLVEAAPELFLLGQFLLQRLQQPLASLFFWWKHCCCQYTCRRSRVCKI